jgi:hypothetical protein
MLPVEQKMKMRYSLMIYCEGAFTNLGFEVNKKGIFIAYSSIKVYINILCNIQART